MAKDTITTKSKKRLFGGYKTTVTAKNADNVKKTRMAQVYQGDNTKLLKKQKVVYKTSANGGVIKIKKTDYGPIEANGRYSYKNVTKGKVEMDKLGSKRKGKVMGKTKQVA
jgi:hypothetical protein